MEQFGKYQLIRRIGAGGMAEVFLARTAVAQGLAKDLVIKKILASHDRTPHFVSMFVDEAKIALGLNHPNIVQVFDFGQVGDTFFLAMEYIAGLDLLRLLQATVASNRRIPLSLCAYIVQEMAKGLDYAHHKTDEFGEPLNIVHRDVSPQNVLLSWDGTVKIVDFGIARARGIDEEEGVIRGKYSYMAPEQARAERVDKRADVYSAGVVLFELCCGRPLFPGRDKHVLAKVRAGAIPRPRGINPDIPESLERIILDALATDPDRRYATARDLQIALRGFQFEQAQSAHDIIDSDTIARYLAEVIPVDERAPRRATRRVLHAPDVIVDVDAGELDGPAGGELDADIERSSHHSSLDPQALEEAPLEPPLEPSVIEELEDIDAPAGERKPVEEVRTRKHVVVMEGVIRGLASLEKQVGALRARKLVEQFFEVARAIAFKHESYVYDARDGNITIMVGLPVVREDDTSRAIRVGLALIEALDSIGQDLEPELRLSVGIQRGTATVAYRQGRPGLAELGAADRSIARRLAVHAPGAEILVGSQVYRVARRDWYFEPAILSRGPSSDAEPEDATATVYRLRGPKERAVRLRERVTLEGEVIGRDLEMKALSDAYRDVLNVNGVRQILLVGDAGVGKRTVVNAFLSTIPKGEALIIRADTQVATAYTPYALIADLIRDLLGVAEGADIREVERRIERLVQLLYQRESESREARALAAAIGVLLGTRAKPAEFDAEELRDRIVSGVIRIQKLMQPTKPIVVVGEDMHWADDESLELLRHILILPQTRATLGIVTSRPDKRVTKLAADLEADVMHVGELDPESAMQLITRRFAQDTEPSHLPAVTQLAEQIIARTGGNPFFIHEVLDSLIERGIISGTSGSLADEVTAGSLRWVSRDASIQVPTSVEALLATRIDRLPFGQKQALIHASVFGRVGNTSVISQLLGSPARADLDALVERGLLFSGAEDHFAFRNDMSMSVAYGLLPTEERPRLHRIAAQVIESSSLYGEGQEDAVIARHLELAGDADKAAERYMKAAERAVEVGGNADALRLLERALKLLPDTAYEARFTAYERSERIATHLGRRAEREQAIAAMREAAAALQQPARLARAYTRQAEYQIDAGNPHDAEQAIDFALQHARATNDTLAQANALQLRASVARMTGDNENALALCQQALALCDDSREGLLVRASVVNCRGVAQWRMGRLDSSIEAFAETLVIYRHLGLPRREANALNNMGIGFLAMGEIEQALAHYKGALEINSRLGDRSGITAQLSNIGQTYTDVGDLERAERYLRKAMKLAEQIDGIAAIIDVVISLGHVHLQRRELERARANLTRGLKLARTHEDRYQEIRALALLAMAQLVDGAHQNALELARRTIEVAEKMPMPVGQIYGLSVRGLALARMGTMDDAVASSSAAVTLLMEQNRPERAEEILYYHATICEQAGEIAAAGKAIAAAYRELSDKMSRLHDQQLASTYRASHIPQAIIWTHERLLGPVGAPAAD